MLFFQKLLIIFEDLVQSVDLVELKLILYALKNSF